ncbi:MAG: flap endonuclease-1 [Candidatus Pacearchaeota archaeon]|nr:flap endonuclease-1 [Candidatus Pacearchaeota archaeon]
MGLQIGELIPKKEIRLEDLKGKVIAVDAFNALYQFLANIRQPDGTPLMDSKGRVTSHLSGLFYRTTNLMTKGLKPVYVFDGKPHELKAVTVSERAARKEEAEEKYKKAKAEGEEEEMFKWAKQTTKLTEEMIIEAKELLRVLGLPVIQAPSEGEAQCAFLVKKGDAYAVASQDYDSLLFGASRLIQNLTLARKRKLASGAFVPVMPEFIELERVLNTLQINYDQLICLGILVGTDFNPRGIKGIGPKKALQLVQQYKVPALLFKAIEKQVQENRIPEPDFDWHDIFELFKKPEITSNYEIKFDKINVSVVKRLLCKEHDFSEERVESALEKVHEHKKEASQKGLGEWF